MLEKRIIPTLQLNGRKAVKTTQFKDPQYIGDPANIAMIWSDYEAHEIIVTDINHHLNIDMLKRVAKNVFVPVAYGGGITTLKAAREALKWGCEKVILGKCASPTLITDIADEAGSQSVAVSIDHDDSRMTYIDGGKLSTGIDVINRAKEAQNAGAGEIILHSINRDGTFKGMCREIANEVVQSVYIPVVVMGGAGNIAEMAEMNNIGTSGCAAGSLFCFDGPSKNVLVSYRRG